MKRTRTTVNWSNIFTNMLYAFGGATAVALTTTPYRWLFLAATIFLALGSAAHHALFQRGDRISVIATASDELGMYAVLASMILLAVGTPITTGLVFFAITITLATIYIHRIDSHKVIPYAVMFLLGAIFHSSTIGGYVAAALMGIAFYANVVDHPRYHGPLHILWHVLSAAAMTLAFILL